MKTLTKFGLLMAVIMIVGAVVALAGDEKAPTVAEQMAGLQKMCAESATARAERHEAKPLFERLGGYDKVHAMVEEVIRLHGENDQIKRTMEGVDEAKLADHLTDFISAGTGGNAEYKGRNMYDSHAHLELTDADFLAAGGDIIQAMNSMDYGQDEIDEFVCILVSMKDLVVLK
jgi:hemoglobin